VNNYDSQGNALIATAGAGSVNLQTLSSAADSVGTEGNLPTFSAYGSFTPGGVGDVIQLLAAATLFVRATRLRLWARTSAGNGAVVFQLALRSTADSGGTAVGAAITPHRPANQAAQASCQHYTATPTAGAGTVFRSAVCPAYLAASAMSTPPYVEFEFGRANEQAIQLPQNAAYSLAVALASLGGLTAANLTIDYAVTWTEAPA
jgi:hypothetical protein